MTDFELNCWVLGDGSQNVFEVTIPNTKSVSALKEMVQNKKKPIFDGFPADALVLWKVSIPAADFDASVSRIRSPEKVDGSVELKPMDKLFEAFLVPPAEKCLHIIVEGPSTAQPRTSHTPPIPSQPSERYRRLVKTTREGPTPPAQAKSSTYAKMQEGMDPIYDGRYADGHLRDTLTLPAMFYHSAFAQFLDDINNPNFEVPDHKIQSSSDFITKSSFIYPSEDERRDAFLPHLNKAIGHTFLTLSNSDKTQPDGVVPLSTASLDELSFQHVADAILLALREDKNEIGKGGSDPSIQGVLSTRRFWALPQRDGVRNASCCPTVVLATAGPFIMVMAVVITDKVIVQRLTDYIYTGRELDVHDSHCVRIAKIFHALDRSPAIFPFYHVISQRQFVVLLPLHLEQDPSCVTFLAQEIDGGTFIVVKFVGRYGIAAHQHLAEVGFAPQIFYFGQVGQNGDAPSYGQYRMVVMEWINGESAADLKAQGKLPATFVAQVQKAMDLLHDSNYVFGDLRLQNVMVSHEGKIKLVDFDWAGIHGQAKFPAQMNMENIQWPQGVGPQKIMLKKHDNDMLDKF